MARDADDPDAACRDLINLTRKQEGWMAVGERTAALLLWLWRLPFYVCDGRGGL